MGADFDGVRDPAGTKDAAQGSQGGSDRPDEDVNRDSESGDALGAGLAKLVSLLRQRKFNRSTYSQHDACGTNPLVRL